MLKIKDLIKHIKENNSEKVTDLFQNIVFDKTRKRLKEFKPQYAQTLYKKEKITESVISDLHDIVSSKVLREIQLANGEKIDVDLTTANSLVTVYNALKTEELKQKFEDMLSKDLKSFMKVIDFAIKMVK
jgi:hypothetical protein